MKGQDCIVIQDIEIELATIMDKCSCTDPLILGEPGKIMHISTYQFNGFVENECIEVYGTIQLDEAIFFENCDLIFDEGAKIDGSNSLETFGFIDCNLQSCGDLLWDGIETGTPNVVIFRNNILRHSYNGIYGDIGPMFLYLIDNVFNDNRVTVNIGDKEAARKSQNVLNGNTFAQTNDLKDH